MSSTERGEGDLKLTSKAVEKLATGSSSCSDIATGGEDCIFEH